MRTAEQCVNVTAPREGTPRDSAWNPPVSSQIILPPLNGLPGKMERKTIRVRFRIDHSGFPISVEFAGTVDSGYAEKIREIMMRYRFTPAVAHGCVVTSTTDLSITFGGSGAPQPPPPPATALWPGWPEMSQPPWSVWASGTLPPVRTAPSTCESKRPAFSYGAWPDATSPGGNGRVVLRFVVDSAGEPVDSTVRVVESTAPKYLSAVKKSFPSLHYVPAWCDGGPVAIDVQQVFNFIR